MPGILHSAEGPRTSPITGEQHVNFKPVPKATKAVPGFNFAIKAIDSTILKRYQSQELHWLNDQIDAKLQAEDDHKRRTEQNTRDLATSILELEEWIAKLDVDGNEWKARFENQEEINNAIGFQILKLTESNENTRMLLDAEPQRALLSRYDDYSDLQWRKCLKNMERDFLRLEEDMKDIEWRLDEEAKAYYKVNRKRFDFHHDLNVLNHSEAAELKAVRDQEERENLAKRAKFAAQAQHQQTRTLSRPSGAVASSQSLQQQPNDKSTDTNYRNQPAKGRTAPSKQQVRIVDEFIGAGPVQNGFAQPGGKGSARPAGSHSVEAYTREYLSPETSPRQYHTNTLGLPLGHTKGKRAGSQPSHKQNPADQNQLKFDIRIGDRLSLEGANMVIGRKGYDPVSNLFANKTTESNRKQQDLNKSSMMRNGVVKGAPKSALRSARGTSRSPRGTRYGPALSEPGTAVGVSRSRRGRVNMVDSKRIIEPSMGPVKKSAAVKQLPSMDPHPRTNGPDLTRSQKQAVEKQMEQPKPFRIF